MARTPKLPAGVSLYQDKDGDREFYRVRLGVKFLGKGRKPEKKAFPSHAEAVKWVKEKQEELYPHQAEATAHGLTETQVAEAKVALAMLAEHNVTLVTAAAAWIEHERPKLDSETVTDAIEKLYQAKLKRAKGDRSRRHPPEMKNRLTRLFTGYGHQKISSIQPEDVEKMLDEKDGRGNVPSDSQIVKRVRFAKILFRFSKARGWMKHDPISSVELPEIPGEEVVVLTPKQVAKLLTTARDKYPCILGLMPTPAS